MCTASISAEIDGNKVSPSLPGPNPPAMSKQFTKAEVAQHKDEKGMYIIVDDGVYDIASMSSIFLFYTYQVHNHLVPTLPACQLRKHETTPHVSAGRGHTRN